MNSNLTAAVADQQIAELQRTAERERNVRSARARMSGSLRSRISLRHSFRFRPVPQA
jgi:hypothetical protein